MLLFVLLSVGLGIPDFVATAYSDKSKASASVTLWRVFKGEQAYIRQGYDHNHYNDTVAKQKPFCMVELNLDH